MRSFWRTIDHGTARDIALVCLADTIVGASFGAVTASAGLHPWIPITMSLIVFAGGSQFAAASVLLAGGGLFAAVLTGLVINARHLPYGFAVADAIGGPWRSRLLGAHLITDEALAFTQRQRGSQRHAVFWTCGLALFACWNLGTALGALVGAVLRDTAAFGLDSALPAVLIALVMPSLTERSADGRRRRNAALLGAVLAVAATPFLPAGMPVLVGLAGLVLARRPKGAADAVTPEVPR